ncbi:G:T mismatch specific thymine DNA glycosylase [Trichuris trichiura]|uniref:G/T mismatch-specific thymine DNA glycosylase n=1 Tax=Trichuris trichiura TaxID=36087 RepID=A0A077Z7P7_TRITR|nr:G:T mismatch specific thymine DNA glycosylase [Trichuris trichiura]
MSPCCVAFSSPLKTESCSLASCSSDPRAGILVDILAVNLDVLFVGINPSLVSAACGHHYAGRGNHFWSALFLSGLVTEPLTAYDDWRLPYFGIGLTNIVDRETRSSAELSHVEIRRGAISLRRKISSFQPKIVAFNGKVIYSAFSGKSSVEYGLQNDVSENNGILYYVMPSSSARCSQFPRLIDKVPFFVQLKKLRDGQRLAVTKAVAAMNSQHSVPEKEDPRPFHVTPNGSTGDDGYCAGFESRHAEECYTEETNPIEEVSKWSEANIPLNLASYTLTTAVGASSVTDDQVAVVEPPTPNEVYGDESEPGSVHSEGVDLVLVSHTVDKAPTDVNAAKAVPSTPSVSSCSLPQEVAVHVEEAIETVVQRARDGPLEMPAFRAPPERHHTISSVQHQNVLANLAVQQGLSFGLDDLGLQTGKSDQLFACYNDQMPFEAYYHQARAVAAAAGGQAAVSYQQPQQLSTHNDTGSVSTSFLNASQAAAACYGSVLPQWTFSAIPTTTSTHDMYSQQQQQQAAACRAFQGQSPYFQPSTSFPSPTGGLLNQQMYSAAGLPSAYLNPQTQQLQSSLYGSYMSSAPPDFQLQQNSSMNQ